MLSYKEMFTLDALYESFQECKKNVKWKHSIQEFEKDLLLNINKLQDELYSHTYKQLPPKEFTLNERGKIRRIKALHIRDRVVQKNICKYLLTLIKSKLIYDNGASLKGKGLSFSRRRFEKHLRDAYRKYGGNGYIIKFDFSKYFDNIDHKILKEIICKFIQDEELKILVFQTIDNFSIYANDDYTNRPIDIRNYEKGNILLHRSVGIGSEFSQIVGILYPYRIDNYFKIVKGIKFYGRYMDDGYIITDSKVSANILLNDLIELCNKYKIFLNENKTKIIKLSRPIKYLQIRYKFTDTGHLIKKISRSNISRQNRKILKFKENKNINMDYMINEHKSFIGTYKKYDTYKTLKRLSNNLKEALYVGRKKN